MWLAVITFLVLALGVCSVGALLRKRDHADLKKALRDGAVSPGKALEEVLQSENSLGSLAALFRDDDHSWLSSTLRMKDEAKTLKIRRIKLARLFLKAVDENFSRLLVIHDFVSVTRARSDSDKISEMAFRFRLKVLCARLLLPINYIRYQLNPLASLLGSLNVASGIVRDRLTAEAAAT